MAKAFDLSTVAEGIETHEQLAFLKQNGCHSGQGFLFSKSLPFDHFLEFAVKFEGDLLPDLINRALKKEQLNARPIALSD